jgi:hypothetical protein
MRSAFKSIPLFLFLLLMKQGIIHSQDNQAITRMKVNQLIGKKAEFNRLSEGVQDGYRIKIHFGIDSEQARNMRTKFNTEFPDYPTYQEYQQPNFVVLVGDFKTKLEAFATLKKIQGGFPNAFIVKGKIKGI